ncbi:MAG: hypothetical protein J6J33_00320, partial [Clostridia bacterium]|nr:hypothetical protein [Clostridia bacterium]
TFDVQGVTYTTRKAFLMENGMETFVLYLCSYTAVDAPYTGNVTETKYCYILFSDSCAGNQGKTVVATYTNIRNSIITSAEITDADDVYYAGNTFGTITATINDVAPTSTKTLEIKEKNGYVFDYLTVTYEGRVYRVDLNDITNASTDGVITHYDTTTGKYTYTYQYTDTKTYVSGETAYYLIDNTKYLMFTKGTSNTNLTVRIVGIYHNIEVKAYFKSHVVLRLEAEEENFLTYEDSLASFYNLYLANGAPAVASRLKMRLFTATENLLDYANYVYGSYEHGYGQFDEDITMYFLEIVYFGRADLFGSEISFNLISPSKAYCFADARIYNHISPIDEEEAPHGEYDIEKLVISTTNDTTGRLIAYRNDDAESEDSVTELDNSYGGRSFMKFRIDVVGNKLHVNSYLNVTDTDGNIYASRLDPYSKNTWFNGDVISDITANFYPSYKNGTPIKTETYDATNNFTYFGNTFHLTYKLIDGYSLTGFRLYGQVHNIGINDPTSEFYNENHATNLIGLIDGTSYTFKYIVDDVSVVSNAEERSTNKFYVNDELNITVTYDATTETYTFAAQGDILSYLDQGFAVDFYSTPEIFDVTYHSNKNLSSSPLILNTITNPVKNPYNVASAITNRVEETVANYSLNKSTSQKFVYNQVFGYGDITSYYNSHKADETANGEIQIYNSAKNNNPNYCLLKQMIDENNVAALRSIDEDSAIYDDFIYTNRLDFYPFDMIGYTFIGWTSGKINPSTFETIDCATWADYRDWEYTTTTDSALYNNCASFVANA